MRAGRRGPPWRSACFHLGICGESNSAWVGLYENKPPEKATFTQPKIYGQGVI